MAKTCMRNQRRPVRAREGKEGGRGEIVVVTTNKHKLAEIKKILKIPVIGCHLRVKEEGQTFAANALKKARAGAKKFGQITLADDSG